MGIVEELLRQTRHNPGLGMLSEIVEPGLKAPSVEAHDSNLGSKLLEHVVGLSYSDTDVVMFSNYR
jgi:hypothetical protein